ncbi:hypothetical protein [Kaistia sp. UC242_56]|uniref:hypothetical protein n=1 Tax=Kaistia sp. UC242_56 TaxID=3374625 RepID=UPI00378E44E7
MAKDGKGMAWSDFNDMSVKDGKLFWDGKEVATKQIVSLRWIELILATVVAISALVTAVWPIALQFGWFGIKAAGA